MTDLTTKTPEASELPKKGPILSDNIQEEEQCRKSFMVTLPEHWTLDDLKDDKIWKTIQSGPHPLSLLDKLFITDFECSWYCECIVAAATETGASLQILVKKDLPPRTQTLPQSEDYRLVYAGKGYQIQHKKTRRPIGAIYMSKAAATQALFAMTPRAA